MIYPISKPTTDDFTFDMFQRVVNDLAPGTPSYYMWSNPPSSMQKFIEKYETNAPLLFLGIKDLIDCWKDFNFWHDTQQVGSQLLAKMARQNPATTFVIFTSLEHLEREIQEPNLHIVPWGGDYVNQREEYLKLEPVFDKNFDSNKSFICLNRNRRDHRITTLSYLFGADYAKYGQITYLWNSQKDTQFEPKQYLDRICWEFDDERHVDIREKILTGYELMMSTTQEQESDEFEIYKAYGKGINDNIGNFNIKLRPRYRNSFVEVVSESSFAPPSFMLTEKTAHSFFGCNFPIILSGRGAIQHLRDIGFDMFDDVVDHNYDLIANPFDRITAALDANKRLLTDVEYAKQTWLTCQKRFENNIHVYSTIFDWYENRVRSQLTKILEQYQSR